MFNKLEEIIKKVEGNVLVIGLDNKLLDKFDKNNKKCIKFSSFEIIRLYEIKGG